MNYNTDDMTNFDPTAYHNERNASANKAGGIQAVDWSTKGLRVTRLRLLSDPGYPYWDVSYCHGELNGKHVDVLLPFSHLPKRGMSKEIVEHAKRDGVFAKGLGILGAISMFQ